MPRLTTRLCAVLIVLVMLAGPMAQLAPFAGARTTKEFSDGKRDVDLEFPSGTETYVVNITIPRSAQLSSAYVGVTGMPLGSVMTYPKDPTVDLGNDGTVDWKFTGTGYGAFGRQRALINDSPSAVAAFDAPGTNSSMAIRLPAEAKIVTATMRVTGEPHAVDWWDGDWLYRVPVSVHNNRPVGLGEVLVDVWLDMANFTVKDEKEFRVIYQPAAGPVEERPSQVVDPVKVSGVFREARVVFLTKALGADQTQDYYIYLSNPNPPAAPMAKDFRPNDIKNRPYTPLPENQSGITPNYFLNPAAVAVHGNDLYVADKGHHVVRIFDGNGTVKGTIGTFASPGNDNLRLNSPAGVAVGPDGRIYISDSANNRVQVFYPNLQYNMSITDGEYVFNNGNTNLTSPHGIRVMADGTIILADTGNHLIQRFNPNGSLKDSIGNPGWTGDDNDHFNSPYDVCVRDDGYVLVADWNNNRIQIFNSNLVYHTTFGTMGAGTGEFLFPAGVDCKGDYVYVADTANHRVQMFYGPSMVYQGQFGATGVQGAGADELNQPGAVIVDDRSAVHIVDTANNRVVRAVDIEVTLPGEQGVYPRSPSMDIGDDGLAEWTYPGDLIGPITTPEMKVRLNVAVYGATPKTDSWGNRYVDLPIKLGSAAQGALKIDQIDVQYEELALLDATTKVKAMLDAADPNATLVNVPIKVTAGSGKVRLSNVSFVYDMPPTLLGAIPSTYGIDEDTSEARLMDLHSYFKDDIDPKENLTFSVASRTNASIVSVTILDNRYLSVDAFNGTENDDWHGIVSIVLACTNKRGLRTETNQFSVTVRSVNDRPVFKTSPVLTATEEQDYLYQALAYDGDGDELTYILAFGPQGMSINASSGALTWRPEGHQVGTFPVEVLADDGDLLTGKARQLFNLTVKNVNDPPSIISNPYTEAEVGQEYTYKVIVNDDDNDNITFSFAQFPKGMVIDPKTGEITWKPKQEQVGKHKVSVKVDDGSMIVKHDFNVTVKSTGTIGGIPTMYLVAGLGLLILVIIIVVVVVVIVKRRKAAAPEKARREEARRRAEARRKGKALEERIDEGEDGAEAAEGEPEEGDQAPASEPEECPKCGDLIEVGLGYCSSCGHVIKKEGEVIPKPKIDEATEEEEVKVVAKEDPGPQRGHELSKFEQEEGAVETIPKQVVVEKPHEPPAKVEVKAVEPEAAPEPSEKEEPKKPKKEEGKKSEPSLDDIMSALKD